MAWSLVCPSSRGIGFQLTRHLLQTTKIPVIATARKDVTGVKKSILADLPDVDPERLNVLEVDVTSTSIICVTNIQIQQDKINLNKKNEAILTSIRRIHHHPRSRRRQNHVSPLIPPPPPRVLHPRNPLPRKITCPTRRAC